MNKLIVILGPTASGKSNLAVKLAKFFNGEIISADSRQIYKRMNIGTGKITKREMQNIPHHLLDVVSPKTRFTIARYQKLTNQAIKKIIKNKKIPIIVGGSGFYIQAITDGINIPHVKPNWPLRKKLEKKSVIELYKILKKLDPQRAKSIERKNPRRLIRALEIVLTTKKPVPAFKKNNSPYQILILGIKKSKVELKKLIRKRLLKRLNAGMVEEVKKLKKSGLSWKRLEEFGLEYKWISFYLQNKISYTEMVEKLQHAIEQFSRRQMVWFSAHGGSPAGKKQPARQIHPVGGKSGNKKIIWLKNYFQAKKIIDKFIKN